MAKSVEQLWRERTDLKDIGNPQLRRALKQRYEQERQGAINQYQAWAADNTDESGNVAPIADYFAEFGAANYTVKDGDNLSTIAGAKGTTVPDLLKANPDVKQLQTGMVINTPRPQQYLNSERGVKRFEDASMQQTFEDGSFQNIPRPGFDAKRQSGGIGVPSAGPIGGVQGGLSTQQQQGMLALSNARSGQSQAIPQLIPGANVLGNPFAANQYKPPNSNGWNPNAFATPAENIVRQQAGVPLASVPGLTNPNQPQINPSSTAPRPRQYAPRENLVTLLDSITGQTGPDGRMPNALELKLLEQSGRIVRAGQNNSLYGNYSYSNMKKKQKGRGGGGGGGLRPLPGGSPRVGQGDRLPAFSNGAGNMGLINWRI